MSLSRPVTQNLEPRGSASAALEAIFLPELPVWLDAAQAIRLLAFSRLLSKENVELEPEVQETRDWVADRGLLLEALRSRAERRLWKPLIAPSWGAWRIRAHVRRLMRDTSTRAMQLASELEADLKRIEAFANKIRWAQATLCEAVRDKKIKLRGREGSEHLRKFTSGNKRVPWEYFMDPLNTITIDGWATISSEAPLTDRLERSRESRQDWGSLCFKAAQVLALAKTLAHDAASSSGSEAKARALTEMRHLLSEEPRRKYAEIIALCRNRAGCTKEIAEWAKVEVQGGRRQGKRNSSSPG